MISYFELNFKYSIIKILFVCMSVCISRNKKVEINYSCNTGDIGSDDSVVYSIK